MGERPGDEFGDDAWGILFGEDGIARWFHDRGCSAAKLLELDRDVGEFRVQI